METEIQGIIDGLAASLGRSVVVEEPGFKLLAVSTHYGRPDSARIDSLLRRQTATQLVSFLRSQGIGAASDPMRIPANPQLDLLPRLVLPLRVQGQLLGHLWLIDHDPPVSSEEVVEARHAAVRIGEFLRRHSQIDEQQLQTDTARLERALDSGDRLRRRAFDQLRRAKQLHASTNLAMCAIRLPNPEAQLFALPRPGTFYELLRELRDSAGPGVIAGTTRDAHLMALTQASSTPAKTRASMTRLARSAGARCDISIEAIGLGGAFTDADELPHSLDQAKYAARVAAYIPELDGQATWDELGALRMFYGLEWTKDGVATLHPSVLALLHDPHSPYAPTVMTYLEHGGNAQATAAALHIHRTTLYYRLNKAQELLGHTIIHHGSTWFTLYAALKLARLTRIGPFSQTTRPD